MKGTSKGSGGNGTAVVSITERTPRSLQKMVDTVHGADCAGRRVHSGRNVVDPPRQGTFNDCTATKLHRLIVVHEGARLVR